MSFKNPRAITLLLSENLNDGTVNDIGLVSLQEFIQCELLKMKLE
jgi:hypothetical protein